MLRFTSVRPPYSDHHFRRVIFSRTAVPVIISLHATVHACRSQYGRRDRIATVIAPQANSLFNWLGRRSGNHECSDSKEGIDNLRWCRIDIHASSGVAQSLQSISSDGIRVGAETEDQLRQIGLFGQSEGSLKMYNIRCKSKETTSFAGGVALSEEYINSEEDAWGRYIANGCRRKAGHSQRRLSFGCSQILLLFSSAPTEGGCWIQNILLFSIHIGSRSTTCH